MYLPPEARWSQLMNLPESENIGKAINDAMRAIEAENDDLRDVLPKTYNRLDNLVLFNLLKNFNSVPMDIEGDAFGKIYEYFLGNFAMSEGQRGGEFFTPTALVKLIVEIIEPFHGRIYDPACGSGGMFVQSANFVARHRIKNLPGLDGEVSQKSVVGRDLAGLDGEVSQKRVVGRDLAGLDSEVSQKSVVGRDLAGLDTISIYGQERVAETVRLCKMNLAVHGLGGDIRQGNSYYEDLHNSVLSSSKGAPGKFDFVMANPPFNVNNIDKERIKDDTARFPLGMPRVDNGNYLWIQLFYSSLNSSGRAGFVMANSASDARQSELEIRKQLIEDAAVDVMVAVGGNFFYTVTLPCTLWFLDKGKAALPPSPKLGEGPGVRASDTVLFLDARHIYRQIDRAHRDFTPKQIDFLANIVRLYRGEDLNGFQFSHDGLNLTQPQIENLQSLFSNRQYQDVPGLCKVATRAEIAAQGWSLNPGRYVGVAERAADDFDFAERLTELNEELEVLNSEARELKERIAENISILLEQ
ncbi:MAG: type I restriction-modification system subunit M [Chloroflexi bacterium]|nr:type I restriction-modification system subunit M [Chloroflexota bacterium]